jgi:hypothetical protein
VHAEVQREVAADVVLGIDQEHVVRQVRRHRMRPATRWTSGMISCRTARSSDAPLRRTCRLGSDRARRMPRHRVQSMRVRSARTAGLTGTNVECVPRPVGFT